MPTIDHHPLGPSRWPAILACPHYRTREGDAAADEGTRQHAELAAVLRGELDPAQASEGAAWAAAEVRRIIPDSATIHVEERVSAGWFFGTPDAYADTPDCIYALDFKAGAPSDLDYGPQLAGYACAISCDAWEPERVYAVTLFGATQAAVVWDTTVQECWNIALRVQVASNTLGLPVPCAWCAYCADAVTCPAALGAVAAVGRARDWGGDLAQFAHPHDLTDPATLAQLFELHGVVSKWCDSVADVKRRLAQAGTPPPGWRVQTRRGVAEIADPLLAYNRAGLTPEQFLGAATVRLSGLAAARKAITGESAKVAAREIEALLGDAVRRGEDTVALVKERKGVAE